MNFVNYEQFQKIANLLTQPQIEIKNQFRNVLNNQPKIKINNNNQFLKLYFDTQIAYEIVGKNYQYYNWSF